MAGKLAGKRAVITGASAGIGAATAVALAEEGASLVLGARRVEKLEAVRDEVLRARSDVAVAVLPLDVTDRASCEAFAKAVLDAGPADVLLSNAGLARGTARLAEATEEDLREMVETNVLGLLRLTRLFLPHMIERRQGHVIQLGSVAALEPYAGGATYCATKAAVRVAAKALRHELLGTGVRVTTVEPGAVETEFSAVRFRGDEARAQAVYQGFQPLSARDVAEVIAFAATRPPHVDVEQLTLYPVAQAATYAFHRESPR